MGTGWGLSLEVRSGIRASRFLIVRVETVSFWVFNVVPGSKFKYEMGKEESPQISRRTTRLSSCNTPNLKAPVEASKATNKLQSSSVDDLVFRGECINLDELINSFPGRTQILELINLLGPLDSPWFRHLSMELLLHRKNESNGYLSAKRCEKPSDFVNLLRQALSTLVDSLKGNPGKLSSKKSSSQVNGRMVYLIFDNLEVVREWDKSFSILPLLFNLFDILKMPELGLIFISRTSLDTFQSDTGYVEPFPVYFPDYTEDDLRLIFMKNQANPKLYSLFWSTITRRVDELSMAFLPLFKKYCEPLGDSRTVPSEDMKRKLFSHLQPFISLSLNETSSVPSQPLLKPQLTKTGP
ncbi:Origin of replication complex subunit [Sesamum angolense]|uniref:Origin of replication complex subunit n=1 Tax=Sesamum angolense TaxID=2727404 RepID=A0AAE2C7D3_9LAMI|nr:Origin of replication complex subunit [Sesamum angolense]